MLNTPTSFLGKCATVLVGMGLSWATLTNPEAERFVQQLIGPNPELEQGWEAPSILEVNSQPSPVEVELAGKPGVSKSHVELQATSQSEQQRLEEMSDMLKELGATYLRVEKLAKSDETWFRVRCDLANNLGQVNCCLESTRDTAIAAMEAVLQAAHGMERSLGEPAAG